MRPLEKEIQREGEPAEWSLPTGKFEEPMKERAGTVLSSRNLFTAIQGETTVKEMILYVFSTHPQHG